MLELWKNPIRSAEENLAIADGEINRLRQHLKMYEAECSSLRAAGFENAQDLYTSYEGLRQQLATLTEQRDQLLADEKESEAVRDRLAKLLSETAIALKGEEEALTRHSWHDLPVLALAAKVEAELMKQQRDTAVEALESAKDSLWHFGCDRAAREEEKTLAAIQSSEVKK